MADALTQGPAIDAEHRRGAAGVAVHRDVIYVAGGACDGHLSRRGGHAHHGLSTYAPRTNVWTVLDRVPHPRDHFEAVIVSEQFLVLAGGRDSPAGRRDNPFQAVTAPVDVYDLKARQWMEGRAAIPTPRGGTMTQLINATHIVVMGGETALQSEAFTTVECYGLHENRWSLLPPMRAGRHTGGAAVLNHVLYVAAGVGQRGGSPLLQDTESLQLPY